MKHLLALLTVLGIVLGVGAGWYFSQPNWSDVKSILEERPYQAHVEQAQAQSFDFVRESLAAREASGDNPRLLFGSSELSPVEGVSTHPSQFFGEHNYGFDTMTVGRPFFQDFWHAVEVGALDDDIPQKKAVFFIGIQWFMVYQDVDESYRYSFSEDAYRKFMENPDLSDETKDQVRRKALAYGIEPAITSEPSEVFFPDAVDNAVGGVARKLDTTRSLIEESNGSGSGACTSLPAGRFGALEEPDWSAWLAAAEDEAKRTSTTNDEGFIDYYYESSYNSWLDTMESCTFEKGSEYLEDEWEDFELLLQVCKECDVEPLIVIMPVKGVAYDRTAYTADVRAIWYDRIRETCDRAGVEYADFSDHEYDRYFLRDVMHLGWTGWVHVNHAIYDFYKEDEQ